MPGGNRFRTQSGISTLTAPERRTRSRDQHLVIGFLAEREMIQQKSRTNDVAIGQPPQIGRAQSAAIANDHPCGERLESGSTLVHGFQGNDGFHD